MSESSVASPEAVVSASNGNTYGSIGRPSNPSDASDEPNLGAVDREVPPKVAKPTRALSPDLLKGTLMCFMALDHVALSLSTFRHGTGQTGEEDGAIVHEWNRPVAYVIRTLTHLCAPGFTFLMGMGVVYLSESRTKLGWSSLRLLKYFAIRALLLTILSCLMGVMGSAGQIWILNMVLFSLAVDLLFSGALLVVVKYTEPGLAEMIAKLPSEPEPEDPTTESLLQNRQGNGANLVRARYASWFIHNVFLLMLSLVTIWWNHWLSPHNGHCQAESKENQMLAAAKHSTLEGFLRLWLWPVMDPEGHVMSMFPPMAWLSFSIIGLVYGRILKSKHRSRRVLVSLYSSVAIGFFIIFVMTRTLRFGNLSEGCLQTPAHRAHPSVNPYLVSPQSFFYIIKYPPDFAFWSFTLAGNFLLLALFDAIPVRIASRFTILLDFGGSALFFYFFHLYLAFGLGMLLTSIFGEKTDIPGPMPGSGEMRGISSIPAYLAVWAAVLLIMWPACRWYSRFKSQKPADSIWRFF